MLNGSGIGVPGEMAGGEVALAVRLERRLDLGADPAARAGSASGSGSRTAGSIGLGTSPWSMIRCASRRAAARDRREQRLRVRVQRPREQVGRVGELDDLAEVHHGDAVGDVADDGEVVRDEEVGQPEVALQLDEQVQDLGLDRDVERRDGSSATISFGCSDERARDADALALAAGELVRVAVERARAEPDALERLGDPLARARSRPDAMDARAPRRRCRATVMRGSSEPTESWKMICIVAARAPCSSRRRELASGRCRRTRSSPAVGSISRSSVRPSVDLPQPDSPTRPSVSPRARPAGRRRRRPARAPTVRRSSPACTGKYFLTPRRLEQRRRRRRRRRRVVALGGSRRVAAARSLARASTPSQPRLLSRRKSGGCSLAARGSNA